MHYKKSHMEVAFLIMLQNFHEYQTIYEFYLFE